MYILGILYILYVYRISDFLHMFCYTIYKIIDRIFYSELCSTNIL